jgi:hypothetical protein
MDNINHIHPDPFLLEFHHTRYQGGCLFEVSDPDYKYQTIVPWVHNFDILITGCEMDWHKPSQNHFNQECAWKFSDGDSSHHHHRRSNNMSYIERVHVHSDRKYHGFFLSNVLDFYEKRFDQTGEGIILHSGSGDASLGLEFISPILNSRAVLRWIIEQNQHENLIDHPKVIQLPVGICERENVGIVGTELRKVISETTIDRRFLSSNITISGVQLAADDTKQDEIRNRIEKEKLHDNISNKSSLRKLLTESMQNVTKWADRKDKIFFCYQSVDTPDNENRHKYIKFAQNNCSFCDVCNGTGLPHVELWKAYGQYKFVFSPHGEYFPKYNV